jgi:hypothetical protein
METFCICLVFCSHVCSNIVNFSIQYKIILMLKGGWQWQEYNTENTSSGKWGCVVWQVHTNNSELSFKYTNKLQCYTIFFITINALQISGGSSKQAWHIPDVVCTVFSSSWSAHKPPETCRALMVIKNMV